MRTAPVKNAPSSNKEPIPPGVYLCRFTKLIDLGTHPTTDLKGKTYDRHTVRLGWEICSDDPLPEGEYPPAVFETLTWSMSERATLRQRMSAMLGKALSDEAAATLDIAALVEAATPCQIQIVHKAKSSDTADGVWVNIGSIMAVPKGMQVPPARGEITIFDLDNPDDDIFQTLGKRSQELIISSREWQARPALRHAPDLDKLPDPF